MSDRDWKSVVRKWSAALAIFAMLAGGIGIASILIFGDHSQPAPTAAPRTPPSPQPKVPTPRDFTIGVLVTAHDCLDAGGAGLDDQEYQVTGGHEPQNGDFTVHGTEARIMQNVTLAGPPGAQLKAEATKVVVRPDFGPPLEPTPTQTPQPPG